MDVLMSNWANPVQSLPERYIFPPDKRPGTLDFPVVDDIPIIDLQDLHGHNRAQIIQHIFYASQEFGFFQVINHGIPASLMDDTMNVMKEFFETAPDHKASFYSTDFTNKCRVYSSTLNYDSEEIHYWRDNITHHCHPLHDYIHLWPQNPTRYRQVVGKYSIEAKNLLLVILELISQGLGLKDEYFKDEMSKTLILSVNHHIPCPDPSLTLAMPQHSDPNLITLLHQCSVPGLQVLRHGQWMNVEPMPDAFIVIPGLQLKVISNGRFSSPDHRVMAHSGEARTTIGTFLMPSDEVVIEPAEKYDPVYRGFRYSEFFSSFIKSNCEADIALGLYKNETK